jgi:SnoaL-like domain
VQSWHSGKAVADMIASSDMPRDIMGNGSAHIATKPVVRIDVDKANAVCHGRLLRFGQASDFFRIWRATAVAPEIRRTEDGWKIYRRVNRLRGGSDTSHQPMRAGLRASGAVPESLVEPAPKTAATQ